MEEEKKYYYIRPRSWDSYDPDDYYPIWQAEEDMLWAGGNPNLRPLNDQQFRNAERKIEDARERIEEAYEEGKGEEEVASIVREAMRHWFGAQTNKDVAELFDICDSWEPANEWEKIEAVRRVWEIENGFPFISGYFRGNNQRDWLRFLCPEFVKDDGRLEYIESVLMSTGREYDLSEEPCTKEEFLGGQTDTFVDYADAWREEDVISWAAELMKCKEEEVRILEEDEEDR